MKIWNIALATNWLKSWIWGTNRVQIQKLLKLKKKAKYIIFNKIKIKWQKHIKKILARLLA